MNPTDHTTGLADLDATLSAAAAPAAPQAPTTPTAVSAAPPVAIAAALPVTFPDQARRLTTLDLTYPVECGGKRYDAVVIRRLTAGEVAAFVESLKGRDEKAGAVIRFPLFFDIEGVQLTDTILDGLDDDDATKLNEVAADFLPLRFTTSQG